MEKVKVAVLGLGMGLAWAKAAVDLPQTELTMVFDPSYDRNDRIDKKFYMENNVRIASSEDELIQSDADVIVVASPDHFHAEQSIKALRAGKHVVCEKPLATTVDECYRIAEAVKESGRSFMTGQVLQPNGGMVI